MSTPVTAKHGIDFSGRFEDFESERIPTINLDDFKYNPSFRQRSVHTSFKDEESDKGSRTNSVDFRRVENGLESRLSTGLKFQGFQRTSTATNSVKKDSAVRKKSLDYLTVSAKQLDSNRRRWTNLNQHFKKTDPINPEERPSSDKVDLGAYLKQKKYSYVCQEFSDLAQYLERIDDRYKPPSTVLNRLE